MAKIRAALVQLLNVLKSLTLAPAHNLAVAGLTLNAGKAEKHMDQKHPR